MKRAAVFAVLIFSLLLAACGDRLLSPGAFSKEFAAEMQKALPDGKVTIKADLELVVALKNGNDQNVYLENSYRLYQQNPADKNAIIARYAASLKETMLPAQPIDRTKITPIIKDKAWPGEVLASSRQRGVKDAEAFDFVFDPFNDELVIMYAEDSANNLRYLTTKDLAKLDVDRKTLRALAVQNLKNILPKIQSRGGKGIYMLVADGSYEASLLLLDDIWQSGQMKVKGDYVVGLPARDVLLVTGTEEKEVLASFRDKVRSLAAEAPYRLTTDLFVYRDGRFVKFND